MKKNQSRISKKPPISGGKTQRKSGKRRVGFSPPSSATRRRLKEAAADQEREALLKEKVLFIERHGSAEFRLHLSNVMTALAKMVGARRAGKKPSFEPGSDSSDYELFLIAEAIRQSREMAPARATSYLRFIARLLPASRPARGAILKAIAAPARRRDELLDLIQVGAFHVVAGC